MHFLGSCSHERSTLYYIESLSTSVVAREAWFVERTSEVLVIEEGNQVIFGHHVNTSARGVYYFETNSRAPFLDI